MPSSAHDITIDGAPLTLTTPISMIRGISDEHARCLSVLDITGVAHLLTHIPTRHERVRERVTLDQISEGDNVSCVGEISATRVAGYGRKSRFEAAFVDDTGRIDLVFFNQSYLHKKLTPGVVLRVQGKANQRGPGLQIANPKFDILEPEALDDTSNADDTIRAVYRATEGITPAEIREIITKLIGPLCELVEDHLSDAYRAERAMPALGDAYRMLHAPAHDEEIAAARRRLAYDELLLMQLGVHLKRAHLRHTLRAPEMPLDDQIEERIASRIPFTLTGDQSKVSREIASDMASSVPMNRLVQGDVGSGKTVVALGAMLRSIAHGHQAALMAPTEILAEQHFASFERMLEGSRTTTALLTGSLSASERKETISRIRDGSVDLVIGTHALVSDAVQFRSLGLAVIDEQHRFGVEQRAKLRVGEGRDMETPHVMVMTATPIPRTIGLTIFGDLDISTIEQLPKGRSPITTKWVRPEQRETVYQWVRDQIDTGKQAFIVTPSIEPGPKAGRDLRTLEKDLNDTHLKGVRVGTMHGKLERATRERVMRKFRAREIDALIATSVIEVGVDVPNASVIVIEDADRFGLAQLHQLRGRVGRGDIASVCVLVADPSSDDGVARLESMVSTRSGFKLAERDLEIRGPGDVFGTRQSGVPPFRVANPLEDTELLMLARRDARAWIETSHNLTRPEDTLARRRMLKAHGKWIGLGDVG